MGQYSGMWTLSQASQAVKNQTWTGIAPTVVEYLIVAGGGSGGGGFYGGGGGAGGLLAGHAGIKPGASYFVTVGGGGAQAAAAAIGNRGSNSIFDSITSGAFTGRLQAVGGGHGGGGGNINGDYRRGGNGGSGGGASEYAGGLAGGLGIPGQGNDGGGLSGYYGGGGGAGSIGITMPAKLGGNGGSGIASAISGTTTMYAGGGAQGTNETFVPLGGLGGGGDGANQNGGSTVAAISGTTNTGGGGGGASQNTGITNAGAAGGSGIVIIRYPGTTQFFTGGTLSYANGYVIHSFYANGVLAPTTPTLYANPDYQIARSLRFNPADQTYLGRTPSTTSSTKILTYSAWVKRGDVSTNAGHFGITAAATSGRDAIRFESNIIQVYLNEANGGNVSTSAVFRDPSAWYHIVVVINTTQTISTNRIKVYVNGVLQTLTGTYPVENYEFTGYNVSGKEHNIGKSTQGNYYVLDGYLADVNFIDGVALTPASFGWTNPATGVWAPLDFVGSYGTNGFNLTFSDNTNTTAATLGADTSGNGNNWTPNNFSVTAGADNDSLVDSPTSYGTDTGVGGEVRGNYATLSPLFFNAVSTIVPTNGNLDFTWPSASNRSAYGSIGMSTGKWYCEVIYTTLGGSPNPGLSLVTGADTSQYLGFGSAQYCYDYGGTKVNNNSATAYGASWTTNDVIGVAFDADAGTLTFYKNGVSQGVAFTGLTAGTYVFGVTSYNGGTGNINFGQRPFAYTAPSGYKALCTTNLSTPTIGATSTTLASQFFAPVTYAGTGTTNVIGVGFKPDFTWIKARNVSANHALFNSVRGSGKVTQSNTSAAEATDNTTLTSFDSGGFSLGAAAGSYIVNTLTYTFVAWNWKAGGTAVTNTSGSITSSVSASPTSGFSVVAFNALTGATAQTVGHGLGVAPSMIIFKDITNAYPHYVYHSSGTTQNQYLNLSTTAGTGNQTGFWGSSLPTSSVFGYTPNNTVAGNADVVAFCFAPVAGFSAFGSYTGSGNASGPFVHLGFRPAFVMFKASSTTSDWIIFDTARDTYNVAGYEIYPNSSAAEAYYADLDILSNGFKHRQSGSPNASGVTYIYMAFASNPFKYSLAR